jgi:hypothetical protein
MNMPLIEYARRGLPLLDVPVLDVHAHAGNIGVLEAPSIEEQVAEMDRLGINRAAISSGLALAAEFQRGNDIVAEAIRRYPDRFVGYCHVSANYPDEMTGELERCFAMDGFKAVKVYQVGTPYDNELFEPVWAFAKERRAPVLAHTWGGDLTGLDKAAEAHPDISFMAAHTGSGFAYEPYIKAAEKCPNLYLDLTYSREHTNMIEHIVERAGAERIVWGSDTPCFSMSHQLGKILFARIPDEAKRKIIHDNAARLFGLP